MTRLIRLALMCAICAWGPASLVQAQDPAPATPAAVAGCDGARIRTARKGRADAAVDTSA